MTDEVRDLLRRAVSDPARELDVAALTHTAARRRRTRRALTGAALVTAVVLAGGVTIAALGDRGGEPRVTVASGPTASNEDAGVSVDLPPGWTQLPLRERPAPREVLVVGTTARPEAELISACDPDRVPGDPAAYVTLYEYLPGDALVGPAGTGSSDPESLFVPRPADVAAPTPLSGDCSATPTPPTLPTDPSVPSDPSGSTLPALPTETSVPTDPSDPTDPTDPTEPTVPTDLTDPTVPSSTVETPPSTAILEPVPEVMENHFREIYFVEAQRRFVARVVSLGDPSEDLLGQGFAVLNSLRVAGTASDSAVEPAPTSTTVATPSTTTTPAADGPPDEAAARQEILDAMTAAYGGQSSIPIDESVEGGFTFTLAERGTAASTPGAEPAVAGRIVVRINSVRFPSATRAEVNFDLLVDGQQITATTDGYAVLEGAHWRMGRATFCEITARGGTLHCP